MAVKTFYTDDDDDDVQNYVLPKLLEEDVCIFQSHVWALIYTVC